MNEVNFDFVEHYAKSGLLPNLSALMSQHGIVRTHSECRDESIEPWIQWVTAHTGKPFAEHGIFRLGDAVNRAPRQIWEHLEAAGLQVGAISPINAENRTHQAAFFLPDPWTDTHVSGSFLLKRVHIAICQAVNDNARSRLTAISVIWLLAGVLRYAIWANLIPYLSLIAGSRKRPWRKAMFLDLFLADAFTREARRKMPDFASLFLNAGAHIQHHYMFNSAAYSGSQKNPSWYIDAKADPLVEVYQLYDRIIGQLRKTFPQHRLIVATGLHQDPDPDTTFYWRLRDHKRFLKRIGAPSGRVEPRMSRDFLVTYNALADAKLAQDRLEAVCADDGSRLFTVDNLGCDLFVTLAYPRDIAAHDGFHLGSDQFYGLRDEVSFVAIKNGRHNPIGYLIDSARAGATSTEHLDLDLAALPQIICNAFGANWQ